MEDIDCSDDLFNLDLDSLFEEGDDLLLAPGHHNDSYSLAADLTSVGFGSNNGGGDDNNDDDAAIFSSLSVAPSPLETPPRLSTTSTNDDDGPPQLIVSKSNGTSIYRSAQKLNAVGIKVIHQNDHLQAADTLSPSNFNLTMNKLVHEETVSKLLPPDVNKRHVIEVSSFNGSPALYFKWENGITCEEWLDKVRIQQQTTHPQKEGAARFTVRLRAAVAIAKTLTQFHQSHVVYNALTLENIVLTPFEGDYLATFIDLSDAVICNDEQTFDERKGVDLTNLGIVLNQLFQKVDGDGELASSRKRVSVSSDTKGEVPSNTRNVKKRGKQHTPGEGLPLYLRAMVSTLLIRDEEHGVSQQLRYESANAVYEDLKVMATPAADGNRRNSYFKETEVDHEVIIHSRLKLPKDLFYGRQVQMSMIMHQLQSVTMLGDQPLMALIAGYPGTGKSTLVKQIKKPLADKDGLIIEGKFDSSACPDKVLASALDSFFTDINASNAGENAHMSMRWRISDAVGSGVSCLYDSIPSLRTFMDDGKGRVDLIIQFTYTSFQKVREGGRLEPKFCRTYLILIPTL
eukprot:scaffold569_cov67-Skeletonema_dohrnii-CCMP3373.AAC.2